MSRLNTIDEKVTLEYALNEDEREFLIQGIFRTALKDDDPKYDDSNRTWLESMTDDKLLAKYKETI